MQNDVSGLKSHRLLRWPATALAVVSLGILVVLAVSLALAAREQLAVFHGLEEAAARQRGEQIYRAFETDLKQLQISNRDYAARYDTREFLRSRDPQLFAHNFSADALLGMRVDFVWMTDSAGREIFSRFVDRATGVEVTPAPDMLRSWLARFQYAEGSVDVLAPAQRLVRTPKGLFASIATKVKRADGSAENDGVLQFARMIMDEEIERVQETSRLPVTIVPVGSGLAASKLPSNLIDWSFTGDAGSVRVNVKDSDTLASFTLLRNFDDVPVALLTTEARRDIYAAGLRTTTWLFGSIVLLLVVLGITVLGFLLRMVMLKKSNSDDRRAAEEQQIANRRNLMKQAQHDFLTGLPNRLFLHARVPRLLHRVSETGSMLALIHIDLDHFKNINDSRGHGAGDQLLRVIGKRLRAAVSDADLVVRMGGDEFVIVAPSMPDRAAVESLAQRIQSIVTSDVVIDGQPMSVTASMGISVYPVDGPDVDALLKHADIALYQAKEDGRRCHRFFAADMNERISDYASLEQSLRRAIGTSQIYLDYQPIIDFSSGRVVSLEALVRWRHPEMGSIPPGRFIPVAEKSGLIEELGQQVLEAVIEQQKAWIDTGVPVVPIAVNVSPLQVERVDFAKVVDELTKAVGIEPKWIRFEITESAVTKEPEKLIGTLQKLRDLGSQVLLDDFGTGYSSLSYIDRLPIDIIKIDRAFVRDVGEGGGTSPVINAVIDLARRLNLKTVAEGVETASQAATLAELGCDYGQGYFYSRPVLAHHCRTLLEHLQCERPLSRTLLSRIIGA